MHIQRCDDPSYLSFARQLLRSLSNVKNGVVTKHIADVTVTVRKVFGHEYVSIHSNSGSYLFFTTGDVADQLTGYTEDDLFGAKAAGNWLFPQGYFVRVTPKTSEIVLTTKLPATDSVNAPYVPAKSILADRGVAHKLLGAYPLQVDGVTEPVRYADDFRANHTVWSMNPCKASDIGFDVIGNTLPTNGFVATIKNADTDWPRLVARCTRKDVHGEVVELMVIVTQALEVCAYRTEACDGTLRKNPSYPQQWYNIRDDGIEYVTKKAIPLPKDMIKNGFDGEARAEFARNEQSYSEKAVEIGVRLNSTATRLCFTFDVAHKFFGELLDYGHFAEYAVDLSVGEKLEDVHLTITLLRTFTPATDGFHTYDCDYIMPARKTLKNKLLAIGCSTDDLVLVKDPIVISKGSAGETIVQSKHNVFYIANASTNKNIITLPRSNQRHITDFYRSLVPPDRHDFVTGQLYIESLELRSLSVAYSFGLPKADGTQLSGTCVFVHGVKVFSTPDFDTLDSLIMSSPHLNRIRNFGGTHYYEGRPDWFGFMVYTSWWLDPTTIFITHPNGHWAYRGFYKTQPLSGPSEKTSQIGGVFVFDQIVFYDDKGVETRTSHKKAFEKASGLLFSNTFSMDKLGETLDVGFYATATEVQFSPVNFGLMLTSINFAIAQMTARNTRDSRWVFRAPILSAYGSFSNGVSTNQQK